MTDLKQEISRIQQSEKENRGKYPGINIWYEITKVAYERGELIKLLSADAEYAYDKDGELWLRSDSRLEYSEDPIAISPLVRSGIYGIYRELRSSNFKSDLEIIFKQMISGTAEQFYYAVQIFSMVSEDIVSKSSPFYSFIKKEQFHDKLRPYLKEAFKYRKENLKDYKINDCTHFEKGLYEYCCKLSESLERKSIPGFIEVNQDD